MSDRMPFETPTDHEAREFLRAIRGAERLSLSHEDMRRVAPYLTAHPYDTQRIQVTPSSTEPEEIAAALVAEKLLNAAR